MPETQNIRNNNAHEQGIRFLSLLNLMTLKESPMKKQELASTIIENLGGLNNIVDAENCMTRLRINIRSIDSVNLEALKNTKGVLGVVADEEHYIQVVLGPGVVRDVLEEMVKMGVTPVAAGKTDEEDWKKNKSEVEGKRNKKVVEKIRIIADIFTPMIPAFIASGICNGMGKIIGLLISNAIVPDITFWHIVQNLFALGSNAFLSYLAIFTGVRAAKQFGVNEMLGGMIGAASLNTVVNSISELLNWYNADVVNESILATGAGGIIGVVVGVWILAKIDKWVHSWMPSVLDVSFTPLLSIIFTLPIFVLLIMPATGWISTKIGEFISLFAYSDNIFVSAIAGYVMAALFLPLVLLGLHRGLVPIYALQIEKMGGTTLFPAVAMAGAGQVGAAIAIWIKARRVHNTRLESIIAGALPSGILGIGEPLIYGVTLPMGKPFISAGLGAGFGGAYVMITHTMAIANSPSGILGVTIMEPQCMLNYVIGLLISYVAAGIITWFMISKKTVEEF